MKRNYSKKENGVVMAVFALMLATLILFTALVVNTGTLATIKQELRIAAEAAAHAGVLELNSRAQSVQWAQQKAQAILSQYPIASPFDPNATKFRFGRYEFNHFQPYGRPDEVLLLPPVLGGVYSQVLANALEVTLIADRPAFFNIIGSSDTVSVSAIAVADAPETHCVAPFVLPVCGLIYEHDPVSGAVTKGDFTRSVAVFQEVIFGALPNPNPYPPQNTPCPIMSPHPPLPPGCSMGHMPLEEPLPGGIEVGATRMYPLRGGFGEPSDTFTANENDILIILQSRWPDNNRKGCTQAKLGDSIGILEGGFTAFENLANTAIASLINQSQPFPIHSGPGSGGCHSAWDTACQLNWEDIPAYNCPAAGPVPCSQFPNGRGGCTTKNDIPANAGPAVDPYGRWEVNVMLIAPTVDPRAEYCSPPVHPGNFTVQVNNASKPVVVGFISMMVFDTQLWSPGQCNWSHPCCWFTPSCSRCGCAVCTDCGGCAPPPCIPPPPCSCGCDLCASCCLAGSGPPLDQKSCRGVRAKPLYHNFLVAGGGYEYRQRAAIVK